MGTHHLDRPPTVRRRNGRLTITDGAVLDQRDRKEAALAKAWATRRKPAVSHAREMRPGLGLS